MSAHASRSRASHSPFWQVGEESPEFPPLSADVEADVCIVGAGIAGLTAGYELGRGGHKVVILDDGPPAHGMTLATTAHLSNVIDDRMTNIERWHGPEGARLAVESHGAAIDYIEAAASKLQIQCDFRRVDGYLFCAPEDDRRILDEELAAARRAGLDGELVASAPLGGYDAGPALRFPRQARFHPIKYLAALAEAIRDQGGQVLIRSHADEVHGGEDAYVKANGFAVRARSIVVATNVPINDMFAIHTKQAPYMTYVIAAPTPKGAVGDALFWDTLPAYHYVRLQELPSDSHDLLIVGGEDHKSGQADDADERHARLERWAQERFPMMGPVTYRWGGQCMETVDGLAFIGRNPLDVDNVLIVTGDSGMGMTHGTLGGLLVADLVRGRPNPWEKLYDPSRKTLRAAGSFLKENLNVAAQYADWLTPGDVSSVDEIPRGSGALLREGLAKVAVYRNPQGAMTRLSATCPHLGCIVQWNDAEKSWDCPCHGSRFRPDGEVLNGPANVNLKAAPE